MACFNGPTAKPHFVISNHRGFVDNLELKEGYLPKAHRGALRGEPLAIRKNGGYTGVKHRLQASQRLVL